MKAFECVCTIFCIVGIVGCGGNSIPGTSDKTPNLQGAWTVILSGAAPSQGATPPPSTTLIVNFKQTGNNLAGTVTLVNNPPSSCISTTINSGTTFVVSGNVTHPIEAGSNLSLSINFMAGSLTGTITVSGAASDLSANGLFTLAPGVGCAGGTFSMTRLPAA